MLTLASSWVALWLTLDVVPADTGVTEAHPVSSALLGWSTIGFALTSLCTLVVALLILRLAGTRVRTRSAAFALSVGAGMIATLNMVDTGWNVVLLSELDASSAVGVPGHAATVFGLGAAVYLVAVHWVFSCRY